MSDGTEGKSLGWFLGGLGLGFLIGVTLGLLFAPKSGEELRRIIQENVQDGWNQVKDKLEDWLARAKEKTAEILHELENIEETTKPA